MPSAPRSQARASAAARPARMPGARKGILPAFVEPSLATLTDAGARAATNGCTRSSSTAIACRRGSTAARSSSSPGKGSTGPRKFTPVAEALGEAEARLRAARRRDRRRGRGGRLELLRPAGGSESGAHATACVYLRLRPALSRRLRSRRSAADRPQGRCLRGSARRRAGGRRRSASASISTRTAQTMFRHACRLGPRRHRLEAQRPALPPGPRRRIGSSRNARERQEFVIAGYVPSTRRAKAVGSLVLGVYEDGKLVHVGRVGTGFTEATGAPAWAELDTDQARRPRPFADKLPRIAANGVRWVEPSSSPRSSFAAGPPTACIRQASFKGLRDDKTPEEVVRESRPPVPAARKRAARRRRSRSPIPTASCGTISGSPSRAWPISTPRSPTGSCRTSSSGRSRLVRCPCGIGQGVLLPEARLGRPRAPRIVRRRRRWGRTSASSIDGSRPGLLALVQAGRARDPSLGLDACAIRRQPDRLIFDLDPGRGRALGRGRSRRDRGARAARSARSRKLRQDHRAARACTSSCRSRPRPAGTRSRAFAAGIRRPAHGKRDSPGPLRRQHGETRPERADLRRLSAKWPRRDRRRRLFDPSPRRGAGVRAGHLGGASLASGRKPVPGRQRIGQAQLFASRPLGCDLPQPADAASAVGNAGQRRARRK